ncbi:MAG: CHASE2 domain-containing protein, partial [Planctomycetota bacterium]
MTFASLFQASGVVCSIEGLSQAVTKSGFFNALPDNDGVLRRIPQLIEYNGEIYPSLALATLTQTDATNQIVLKVTGFGVESLRLQDTVIPLDAQSNLLIRYRGEANPFPRVSASDILNGVTSSTALQGKIVFVGTTALGLGET